MKNSHCLFRGNLCTLWICFPNRIEVDCRPFRRASGGSGKVVTLHDILEHSGRRSGQAPDQERGKTLLSSLTQTLISWSDSPWRFQTAFQYREAIFPTILSLVLCSAHFFVRIKCLLSKGMAMTDPIRVTKVGTSAGRNGEAMEQWEVDPTATLKDRQWRRIINEKKNAPIASNRSLACKDSQSTTAAPYPTIHRQRICPPACHQLP